MAWREWVLAGAAALALAGCQATTSAPETALAPAPLVRQEGVSLKGATVALVSLDGAPQAAGEDFASAFAKALSAREVERAEPKKARYLLRVYLAATPNEGGANLDYVADVFDARRIRIGRLNDGVALKGSGDAWSLANAEALDAIAARCAEELAALLSNQPEPRGAAMSYAE